MLGGKGLKPNTMRGTNRGAGGEGGEKGEGLDPVACTNFRIFQVLSIL